VSFIHQSQNNPHAGALIERTRNSMGMHMIERGSMGMRSILRALRDRRMVFILPDQDAGRDGIFVPFFGRPASVAKGTAAFVLKTSVPIIICMLRRRADGSYALITERLDFDFPPDWDEEHKMIDITRRYTAAIESHLRRCPEQWFWLHRRWKNQPQTAEAHADLHA
jgi:KDO2-lipid IV(A) lauroyltransferase